MPLTALAMQRALDHLFTGAEVALTAGGKEIRVPGYVRMKLGPLQHAAGESGEKPPAHDRPAAPPVNRQVALLGARKPLQGEHLVSNKTQITWLTWLQDSDEEIEGWEVFGADREMLAYGTFAGEPEKIRRGNEAIIREGALVFGLRS